MFQPNYTITSNVLIYIARIEAARALIENAALIPAWEAKFREDALTRTVHFGTKIEGNDLTQEQAGEVLNSEAQDIRQVSETTGLIARDRDIQEVINYRNVIDWINKQKANDNLSALLTEESLRRLHEITTDKLLDPAAAGQWRDKQVVVEGLGENKTAGIVFRPPVAAEIPFLIKDFFDWLNSPENANIHPILKAAITHYQLTYIHPFIDGNGRTARAFSTLVLYLHQYDFKRFFSLEEYFDADVNRYYFALQSVQKSLTADLTYWLEYFCYGLAIEVDKVKFKVLKLSKDVQQRELQGGCQVALSERQIIIMDLLRQEGEVNSERLQELLPQVSSDTILRDMKDLIAKGVIKKIGVTKGVRYFLKE